MTGLLNYFWKIVQIWITCCWRPRNMLGSSLNSWWWAPESISKSLAKFYSIYFYLASHLAKFSYFIFALQLTSQNLALHKSPLSFPLSNSMTRGPQNFICSLLLLLPSMAARGPRFCCRGVQGSTPPTSPHSVSSRGGPCPRDQWRGRGGAPLTQPTVRPCSGPWPHRWWRDYRWSSAHPAHDAA
jgi:hypothetical protein